MFDVNRLKEGPGSNLHFLPALNPKQIAETLIAFANTDGGTLVVGLEPSGTIVGQAYSEKVEDALLEAEEQCNPPVVVGTWEQLETEGTNVVAIRVPRSIELHALDDGRVLVRSGSENRPLGGHEIRRLASDKSTGDFELETVPGASLDDFDPDVIEEFILKRNERTRKPWTGSTEALLMEVGACN
jgi:ATP-dependent DNA helicase RecG